MTVPPGPINTSNSSSSSRQIRDQAGHRGAAGGTDQGQSRSDQVARQENRSQVLNAREQNNNQTHPSQSRTRQHETNKYFGKSESIHQSDVPTLAEGSEAAGQVSPLLPSEDMPIKTVALRDAIEAANLEALVTTTTSANASLSVELENGVLKVYFNTNSANKVWTKYTPHVTIVERILEQGSLEPGSCFILWNRKSSDLLIKGF